MLLYAWTGFLSAELVGMVNSILKCAFKYRYSNTVYTLETLSNDTDETLVEKINNKYHCNYDVLPSPRASISYLRL